MPETAPRPQAQSEPRPITPQAPPAGPLSGRLAFSTLGCPGWDFGQIVRNARDLGFSAIEVRGVQSQLRTEELPCFVPERMGETRDLLRSCGVRICCAGTSASFHDPGNAERSLEEGRAAISVCVAMGIPFVRVFGDAVPPGESAADVARRVAGCIGRLCDFAEESGGSVTVLQEVHGNFNTVETLGPVVDALGRRASFGLIWDIEHSYRAYGARYEPFYELVRPFVRHVHVKDCRLAADGSTSAELPGMGEVNIGDIVGRLEADGYAGLYSFEWEKRWRPDIPEPELAFPAYASYMRGLPGA
ncbi:MAG: sugar phosphate isomerase/epimerase [Clostridiales bacterium]|nr:sugar phosphate isomerase/epimerase [Clostridiales bacterium]